MRKIPTILILMLIPQVAFAFMDAPTVMVTLPSYLIILVPIIAFEVAYIPRKIHASKAKTLKVGILIHLLALAIMIVGGWLHSYARHKVIDIIDFETTGIFTILRDPPSVLDFIFSLSIGSVVLIQAAAYRWLNLIVIIEFLLPTFLLSTYFGIQLFHRIVPDADKLRLNSALIQIKGIEYGLLVIASLLYLNFVFRF